eukprot:GEMP01111287.1.p2 GENE.GEMP01111287.1~~GEMP01111287.1.p2  ORF type:complete len:106 (-),score=2.70 GEMP01111287.1:374-691(-)
MAFEVVRNDRYPLMTFGWLRNELRSLVFLFLLIYGCTYNTTLDYTLRKTVEYFRENQQIAGNIYKLLRTCIGEFGTRGTYAVYLACVITYEATFIDLVFGRAQNK